MNAPSARGVPPTGEPPRSVATESGAEASDRDLLLAIAAGDRTALGTLYDRHAAAAMGLAYRIVGDHGTAEEVVQDAFLSVWRRATTYAVERGEVRSWLLGIARNRAIDRVRGTAAAGRRADLDLAYASSVGDQTDVFAETWGSLQRGEIASALALLPAEQRQVIDLAFFGGLTHVEVATQLEQPLGTVKGRMRLGLKRLAGLLRPD